MTRAENKFWDWIVRHRLELLIAAVTLLSGYARFMLRGMVSFDMNNSLLPWYDKISARGGLASLSQQVGDYNIPYQTLIALMTLLPIKPLYGYKMISIFFDYALAAAAGLAARELTGSRAKGAAAYCLTAVFPVMILNSSVWGQCDSIYTFFLMMTFLCLLRKKHIAAFLLYGCAFAFKLQAVFFLPFLLFWYARSRRFSAWHFLLLPLPVVALSAGGLLQGRSLGDLVDIYFGQSQQYPRMSLNYPSFWNLMVGSEPLEDGTNFYPDLRFLSISMTFAVLAVLMIWLLSRKEMSQTGMAASAALMTHTCVLLLPAMHERYAYPVLAFSLLLTCVCFRAFPMTMGLLIIDMETYGKYLFRKEPLPLDVLCLINVLCWIGFLLLIIRDGRSAGEGEPEREWLKIHWES